MGQINYSLVKKNYIKNGEFRFFSGSFGGSTTSPDDWNIGGFDMGSLAWNVSQSTDVPANTIFKTSAKIQCTVAGTSGSNAYALFFTNISSHTFLTSLGGMGLITSL